MNLIRKRYLVYNGLSNLCGNDTIVEIPVPISNTEVKHNEAEGSRKVRIGNCRAIQMYQEPTTVWVFVFKKQ